RGIKATPKTFHSPIRRLGATKANLTLPLSVNLVYVIRILALLFTLLLGNLVLIHARVRVTDTFGSTLKQRFQLVVAPTGRGGILLNLLVSSPFGDIRPIFVRHRLVILDSHL